ncbi:MAG: exo-beta-N-acetylmuramidase NamZ domain-containing protein, partial [Nitrospinaceae bacterium]
MPHTISGIDNLLSNPEKYLKGKTVGLIVNHTSLVSDGKHSIVHFKSHSNFTLQALFAPEHGLYGTAQDMIHISNEIDPLSGLEIKSLYGNSEDSLIPDPSSLQGIDNLVFDIQDVGSRYYTFIYTMANCMK